MTKNTLPPLPPIGSDDLLDAVDSVIDSISDYIDIKIASEVHTTLDPSYAHFKRGILRGLAMRLNAEAMKIQDI